MENIKIIEVLAWPIAALVCFIFACIYFRRHLAALLDRTTSIGKEGLKTTSPTSQSTQEVDRLKQSQELVEALISPAVKERENLIHAELNKRGLDDSGETAKVLIRYLATANLIIIFEGIYRIIYGSQILLLKSANENRVSGLSKESIDQYFAQVRQTFAPFFDKWTVDGYLNFLLTSNLLIQDSGFFKITILGVEFLEWMTKIGAIEKKGL